MGAVFLLRVWGADATAPPRGSWASPLSPFSVPLPGIPLSPGCPWRFLTLAWRAQHHQPRGHAPVFQCSAALPGLCSPSTPPRSLSPSVSPQSRPPDCSRCRRCSSRSPGGSESASEQGREAAAGLPSALLIPSSQVALLFPSFHVPSPALSSAAARAAPAPPGPPKGATRAKPVLPRQPAGRPLALAPCSFPRAPPGGYPLPKTRAPPANGHRGSWQRQGVG